VEITWLGHSCFRIKGKEATVITDPCHPSLGYSLGRLQADIVTVSHFHPGHCYVESISGSFKEIKGAGEYEVKGVFITGIGTFHDTEQGKKRGKNTVYLVEMDGITLCHLGDLGHLPPPELIEEMSGVEVLMLPVGETSTFNVRIAVELVKHLTPRVVIPMHYKTPCLTRESEPVGKFLKEMGTGEIAAQPKLSVSRSTLPSTTQVFVLHYPQK